jgi:hypothetical protein
MEHADYVTLGIDHSHASWRDVAGIETLLLADLPGKR